MKRSLPTFRKLIIQYQHYQRKLHRLAQRDRRSQRKISWIKKRIIRLRSKIDGYIERGLLAKKVAMVAAGLAVTPMILQAQAQ